MSRPLCLITGASTGIGAACARLAAAQGFDLVLTYASSRTGAEAVAADCTSAGAAVTPVQCDVTDPDQIDALYTTVDATGPLAALINNAGVVDDAIRVSDLTHARLRRMFDTNVIGAILVAAAAVRRMEPRGTGTIINVTSAAARLGSANQYVDYAASKAAMDIFTKGLSDEVAPKGLRVMGVAPGLIDTPIHAKGGDPDRAARLSSMVPMQRTGSADEIAKAVLWLMSDGASYITGSTLDVTGGR
ncbi:SDR family oxidoreductase [Sulfitobacter albidus]|uniref:SDR family oxidoreductase n=1 Tax=Sulfitobacter albidus TaxID=2829501 RepID=A0A975JAV1_9RHOB|nr:SDR family oxidoreductase [Sulfitobacter albidus]QUJ75089.1 SDR family oxidoreductase [Sulfitobacter albidus]